MKWLRVNAGKALTYYRLMRVPMCHLPHWCKQQQYLMQWMHSLGAQEVQWAQAPLRGPKLQAVRVITGSDRNGPDRR